MHLARFLPPDYLAGPLRINELRRGNGRVAVVAFVKKGVISLRGKVSPVVGLRLKYGMEAAPHDEGTCIVVVQVDGVKEPGSSGWLWIWSTRWST